MKEILSSQYEAVSGCWNDRDGSGKRSSINSDSGRSGGANGSGATVFKKLHIHYLTRVAAAKHMVLGIPHPIQAAIMAVTAVARIELDN